MYVQHDTLLLADEFHNLWNRCLKICELDLAKFLWAPGLAWQADIRKTKVQLDPLTDIDYLLMIENGIGRRTCHFIYEDTNVNNNTGMVKIKTKNHQILNFEM